MSTCPFFRSNAEAVSLIGGRAPAERQMAAKEKYEVIHERPAVPRSPDPCRLGGGVSRRPGAHHPPGASAAASAISLSPAAAVEVGETLAAALARELMEEVGIEAEILAFNRHVEAIFHEGDRIRTHFVIASFVARWTRGEPRLSDEVDEVQWVDPAGPLPSPTTPELADVLARAARIQAQHA